MDTPVTLKQLLDCLCRRGGLNICIHDISGILQRKYLELPHTYQMHSGAFCDTAKSTSRGFRVCMRCKIRTNEKAALENKMFQGYCCYGVYKIICPVVLHDKVACILYLGNMTDDPKILQQRIRKMCLHTDVDPDLLASYIPEMESVQDPQMYFNIAKLISDHIRYLDSLKADTPDTPMHWAVAALQHYAEENYIQDLSLKDIAKLYHVNHQYIGKLFKEQTGCTFRQYLNQLRLSKATKELQENPARSITEIALDCGFQTITYFNRLFHEHYHMTPLEYRNAAFTRTVHPDVLA